MAITKADSQKMLRLAQEGKAISKILAEDFPKLNYWDVYFEVYGAGERSSQGIKRMITTRLTAMAASTSKSERTYMADELQGLVWHLCSNHKTNQKKNCGNKSGLGGISDLLGVGDCCES